MEGKGDQGPCWLNYNSLSRKLRYFWRDSEGILLSLPAESKLLWWSSLTGAEQTAINLKESKGSESSFE